MTPLEARCYPGVAAAVDRAMTELHDENPVRYHDRHHGHCGICKQRRAGIIADYDAQDLEQVTHDMLALAAQRGDDQKESP